MPWQTRRAVRYTAVMRARLSLLLLALCLWAPAARAAPPPSATFPFPPVRARAAVVMDATTEAVLGAVNPHLRLPMASTTKIMTAIVALLHGKLTDRITVPAAAFNFEADATVMGLHPGEVVTLNDLLYGLMLPSGADAANTIAIHYGGSEAGFVAMMNREAALLGLHDTHYANAHGLPAPDHYSSAYDLAVLGRYAATFPALMRITATRTYRWNGHILTNVNHVLFWYPGVDGIKPGFTYAAGLCQVLDAHRDGRHVIVAILNTPDLVIDARNLLNFGLQDFTWIQSKLTGDSPSLVQHGIDRAGPYEYFPATGHYLRGPFLAAYLANGGADTMGFPRTEQLLVGSSQVQYFQNGELELPRGWKRAHRVPLGLVPLPATATPTPAATPTPTPAPRTTPTPQPLGVAIVFAGFLRSHRTELGEPVAMVEHLRGYRVQIFQYAALAYTFQGRHTYLLPLGDRLLAAQHLLPAHPGNRYPPDFAPASLLHAIGWTVEG